MILAAGGLPQTQLPRVPPASCEVPVRVARRMPSFRLQSHHNQAAERQKDSRVRRLIYDYVYRCTWDSSAHLGFEGVHASQGWHLVGRSKAVDVGHDKM
jgi:hypothetical protein